MEALDFTNNCTLFPAGGAAVTSDAARPVNAAAAANRGVCNFMVFDL
jgi:hypothetical protein